MRAIVLAATAAVAVSTAAEAQEFVRGDCRPMTTATSALRFETPEHARWYKRFWTGTCDDLKFCFSGSPNWNDIVGKLMTRAAPAERAALLPKACRLGQLIGLEWSRDRRIKHIHTADLRTFSAMLEASGDALDGVDKVETKAKAMIASR
ncbi:MAG: hypothetical protein JWP92_2340 [Caulobacter sp.]|nr:hypothetical protein [Caulobacter sp.]